MKIGTSGITKNMFCITPDGNISENNPYSVTLQTSGQPSGISTDTWAKVCYLANNYLDTTKYIATNDIGAAAACTIWDLMLDDNNASGVDFNKDSYADKFYTSHIDGVESARQSIWTDVSGVNSSYLDDWTMSWYQVVANGQSMIMLGENTPNDPPSVPEPATVLGLLAFAPAVISLARRRK